MQMGWSGNGNYLCQLDPLWELKQQVSHAYLFDPRFDAMTEPQLSGCSLTGAQNLTNLPVWETILFGFQQQLLWYSTTAGRESEQCQAVS